MKSQKQKERLDDDLEIGPGNRTFDLSSTAWLVGQGVRSLEAADDEGKLAYQYVIELLRNRKDATGTIIQLIQNVPLNDVPLRWDLLYLLGEVADQTAAQFLIRQSIEPLPEKEMGVCEGPRDDELLVRTRAVKAIEQIANRHPDVGEYLLKLVSEHPAQPILIEAVKAASGLGLKDKVRELLPKEYHWILDIRRARIEEIGVEPERKDTKERGFTPPRLSSVSPSPNVSCHSKNEED
jgi:hypothetical protein